MQLRWDLEDAPGRRQFPTWQNLTLSRPGRGGSVDAWVQILVWMRDEQRSDDQEVQIRVDKSKLRHHEHRRDEHQARRGRRQRLRHRETRVRLEKMTEIVELGRESMCVRLSLSL